MLMSTVSLCHLEFRSRYRRSRHIFEYKMILLGATYYTSHRHSLEIQYMYISKWVWGLNWLIYRANQAYRKSSPPFSGFKIECEADVGYVWLFLLSHDLLQDLLNLRSSTGVGPIIIVRGKKAFSGFKYWSPSHPPNCLESQFFRWALIKCN